MTSERIQRRVDRLLDQIEEAADQRDWQGVHQLAQDVLRLDPENADARGYLAAAERDPEPASSAPPTAQSEITDQPTSVTAPDAERRQLTVMFCDLQGSTALSQQLDPEVLRDVIRSYQEVCAGAVGRFEGHIAKYMGDGLLVYFGYPQAHEDDPQRAVRAGLAILQDMDPLNARLNAEKGFELTVRIGIHTGLVVAGEMGGGDTLEELAIVGETPNVAARIEGAALPNSVVVSNITASLIQGFFHYETLGPHELKGISEPVELFQVLEESGAQTRFEVAAAVKLTPLVGREQELGLLLDRWEQVEEGLGQVVLVSGEAGIGKSRLIDALGERLAEKAHIRWHLRCSAYHQTSTLHPLKEFLEIRLGFERDDSSEEKLAKLEDVLAISEEAPLLASLLSLPVDGRYRPLQLSPEGQKERTKEILAELLMETDTGQPVLLVVEDLHWADPTTLEFLTFLVDQAPTTKLLALLSFRPEFTQPWGSRAHLSQISLNRLPRRLANDMLTALTGGKEFPEEIVTQIANKSDGVPLFVEELTQMVIESGLLDEEDGRYVLNRPLTSLAIPSTLQDSLTARLDRLSSAKESLQLGAVLGREFSNDLIRAVSTEDDNALGQHLEQLVTAEFLYQHGMPPEANYTFKHALVQDAAYNSLLISRRQQYHQQTANVLEKRFADMIDAQPELLAHHYFEAGLMEKAVFYWSRAGEQSSSRYAWAEALAHYQKALSVKNVEATGSAPAEDSETAALLFGLGRVQVSALGRRDLDTAFATLNRAFNYYFAANDVTNAVRVAEFPMQSLPGHRLAMELMNKALELVPPKSPEAGRLLSKYGLVLGLEEGDYPGAVEAFDGAMSIAQCSGDRALEIRTLAYYLTVDFWHRRFKETVEKGLRVIEVAQQTSNRMLEVSARMWVGVAQQCMGESKESQQHALASLSAAEILQDRYWLATALWQNEMACIYKGDWQAARNFSERGLSISPFDPRLLGTRTLLEHQVGNLDDGNRYLDQLVESLEAVTAEPRYDYASVAIILPYVAHITGDFSRLHIAESAAATVLSALNATPLVSRFARLGLGLIAVIQEDVKSAKEQYAYLEGVSVADSLISSDLVLGLLARTMGDRDQAIAHFDDALAFCRKAGYRPNLAWTCCDYAGTLLERDADGDRTKAVSLLEESRAIATELGMRPLVERVQVRLVTLSR